MKMSRLIFPTILIALLSVVLFAAGSVGAALVEDNFDDNSLDAGKWQTSLPPGGAVTEASGRLRLTDGGSLVTQDSFEPDAAGIVISGDMVINVVSDRLFFTSHGGGLLTDAGGERHMGMRWFITGFNGTVSLDSVVLRDSTGGSLGSPTVVSNLTGIVAGSTQLQFVWGISDTESSFVITVAAGDVSGASGEFSAIVPITSPLTFNHTTRYIIFQNNNNFANLDLDNIVIGSPSIPEPAAGMLLGLGGLAFLGRSRRRDI